MIVPWLFFLFLNKTETLGEQMNTVQSERD